MIKLNINGNIVYPAKKHIDGYNLTDDPQKALKTTLKEVLEHAPYLEQHVIGGQDD